MVKRKRGLKFSGLDLMRSWRGALPAGGRDALRQLLILLSAFIGYDLIRIVSRGREVVAVMHAQRLIDLERALHVYMEPRLQQEIVGSRAIVGFFNWFYANMHLPATMLVLTWIYLYRHEAFAFFRNSFLVMNAIGLSIFAFLPMAPPRLVPTSGMVDTLYLYSTVNFQHGAMSFVTNKYAAMPSLHMGYAVFLVVAFWVLCPRKLVRAIVSLYALLVLAAIVVTGNHYILDAVGGVAVVGLAFLGTWAVSTAEEPETLTVPIHDDERE